MWASLYWRTDHFVKTHLSEYERCLRSGSFSYSAVAFKLYLSKLSNVWEYIEMNKPPNNFISPPLTTSLIECLCYPQLALTLYKCYVRCGCHSVRVTYLSTRVIIYCAFILILFRLFLNFSFLVKFRLWICPIVIVLFLQISYFHYLCSYLLKKLHTLRAKRQNFWFSLYGKSVFLYFFYWLWSWKPSHSDIETSLYIILYLYIIWVI